MELEGTKGLFDTSSRTWTAPTVSLRLAFLNRFWDYLGKKGAVLGPKQPRFGMAPPDLVPAPWGTIGEFLAQNLDFARPPRLQNGQSTAEGKAVGWSNGQNGKETCCLLLLLLVVVS